MAIRPVGTWDGHPPETRTAPRRRRLCIPPGPAVPDPFSVWPTSIYLRAPRPRARSRPRAWRDR
jgi:hypothetical protein